MFSLQTGVTMIIWFDFFFFLCLYCMYGLTFTDVAEESQYTVKNYNVSGFVFSIMTDGVVLGLFFVKLFFGLWYLKMVSFPPQIEY